VVATVPVNSSGTAPFTTTSLPLGITAITAVYNGALGNLSSTSPTVAQSVVPYTTLTSLASAADPSFVGQPVTFTASVNTRVGPVTAGTVTFRRGSQFLGTIPLDGAGLASLSVASLLVGTARIQAVYNGTATSLSSVSPVLNQKVSPALTDTNLSASTATRPDGSIRYVLVATVNPGGDTSFVPSGTVIFRRNGAIIGRLKLKHGTAVLTLGPHLPRGKFRAVFEGSSRFQPSTSTAIVFAS
jgi:hypothetical protein